MLRHLLIFKGSGAKYSKTSELQLPKSPSFLQVCINHCETTLLHILGALRFLSQPWNYFGKYIRNTGYSMRICSCCYIIKSKRNVVETRTWGDFFAEKFFWSWQLCEELRRSSLSNMSGMQQWNMKYALFGKHCIKLGIFIGLSRKLHLISDMFQTKPTFSEISHSTWEICATFGCLMPGTRWARIRLDV